MKERTPPRISIPESCFSEFCQLMGLLPDLNEKDLNDKEKIAYNFAKSLYEIYGG